MKLMLTILSLLWAASAAAEAQRVTVAPIQSGANVVSDDIAIELEEAVRSGLMRAAPDLDLRVMSKATFTRMLDEARAQGRTDYLTLPAKTPEDDAALGRVLGTELVVSTKVTKVDGRALMLLKVVRAGDDTILGTAAVDDEGFGGVLARVPGETERLVRSMIAAQPQPQRQAAPAPAAPTVDRVFRAGTLWMSNAASAFSSRQSRCEIHADHLACKTLSILSSDTRRIDYRDITSIYPEGSIINVVSAGGHYKLFLFNSLEHDRNASRRDREREAAFNAQEIQLWYNDLTQAWSLYRGR